MGAGEIADERDAGLAVYGARVKVVVTDGV